MLLLNQITATKQNMPSTAVDYCKVFRKTVGIFPRCGNSLVMQSVSLFSVEFSLPSGKKMSFKILCQFLSFKMGTFY